MATSPAFPIQQSSRSSLGTKARVITAGETDLDPPAKAVSLTSAGDITVVPLGNGDAEVVAYVGVNAGFLVPFVVRRVTVLTNGATAVTVDQ